MAVLVLSRQSTQFTRTMPVCTKNNWYGVSRTGFSLNTHIIPFPCSASEEQSLPVVEILLVIHYQREVLKEASLL